jgi:hypothetical protein
MGTSYYFQGFPNFILARKLKTLKVDLRMWNEEVFGNVERKKKLQMDYLQVLEGLEKDGALSEERNRY